MIIRVYLFYIIEKKHFSKMSGNRIYINCHFEIEMAI